MENQNTILIYSTMIMVVIVVFVFAGILIARFILKRRGWLPHAFKKTLFLVTLPKESIKDQDLNRANVPQIIQEKIGLAEILFSNLGGLRAQRGFKAFLFGRSDHLSLEIVSLKGIIYFFVAAPRYLERFVEQEIHAQYQEALIEKVTDYNIFSPRGVIKTAVVTLARPYIFPIKTYKKLNSDPLNSLTNSLSKLQKNEGAAIQITVRSAKGRWHAWGAKVASQMKQGKPLKEAMKSIGAAGSRSLWQEVGRMIVGSGAHQQQTKKQTFQQQPYYHLSPMEEELIKGLEEKTSKAGLDVNLRVVVSSEDSQRAEMYLRSILDAFAQYNVYQYGNSFHAKKLRGKKIIRDFIYRNFDERKKIVLNCEELASIFHFPLLTTETPNILWLAAKRAPAPLNIPRAGVILGKNIFRGEETLIRLAKKDRRRHVYIIGKSGVGKSFLIANMAINDIRAGEGLCVVDPHGDLADDILAQIPPERAEDVIYFSPADTSRPMGLNLLEYDPKYPEQKTFVINEMIKIFDKLYDLKQTGGPIFEQYMRNAMLLVMDHPQSGSTLMEIPKVLAEADFRRFKLSKCQNPVVKDFWQKEAEKAGGEAALANVVPYVTSKLNAFVANDMMRPIIGQQKSAFNLRRVMDEGKILIVNLAKGKLGDLNAYLIGMVLVGKILMAALSRTDLDQEKRRDFYLYLDEFQNFITDSIAIILSEARKYHLNLTIAHQYIGQLVKGQDSSIRDAVFGNVGTIIAFKIGVEDAKFIAQEFAPVFNERDLINIEKYNAYVKLLIDNQSARPFNMLTLPIETAGENQSEKIKQLSRLKYGRDLSLVEAEIIKRINSTL